MKQNLYTISELEKLTGTPRRNIHFYTQQKVIPPPAGTGGAARYRDEHLLRLLLIREMKKSHLKLSGIREALDAMNVEDMRDLLKRSRSESFTWDAEALSNWLSSGDFLEEPVSMPAAEQKKYFRKKMDVSRAPAKESVHEKNISFLSRLKRTPLTKEESWHRIEIIKGMELHIRSDLFKQLQGFIDRWVESLRRHLTKGSSS